MAQCLKGFECRWWLQLSFKSSVFIQLHSQQGSQNDFYFWSSGFPFIFAGFICNLRPTQRLWSHAQALNITSFCPLYMHFLSDFIQLALACSRWQINTQWEKIKKVFLKDCVRSEKLCLCVILHLFIVMTFRYYVHQHKWSTCADE